MYTNGIKLPYIKIFLSASSWKLLQVTSSPPDDTIWSFQLGLPIQAVVLVELLLQNYSQLSFDLIYQFSERNGKNILL